MLLRNSTPLDQWIGLVIYRCVLQGDVAVATTFHERHQELAEAVDISEEQKTANVELVKVHNQRDAPSAQ